MSGMLAQVAGATDNDAYALWGFILAAGALGLLFLELLVPSGGLLGLLCGAAAIGSIVAFFKYNTTFGVAALMVYAIMGPIVVIFVFKVWLQSPLARRMVLGGDQASLGEEEPEAHQAERARLAQLVAVRELIGAEGISVTALRPVGVVKINGQRVDALAETGIVEADTPVVVTDVYDNQIKVRPKAQ